MEENQVEITKRIQEANRLLVVSHIRPDGDAIGSLLGMGLALQEAGKNVQMVMADGIPMNFRHLDGSEQVKKLPEGDFDLIAVVDCSDFARVGNVLDDYPTPDLNVDHHITNLNFARYNLVDTGAVATAEILTFLLPQWNLPITKPVAKALLTGIVTDTLGFRTSNMTPRALRAAADLMEIGVDMPELYRRGLIQQSFEAIRFWGMGLNNLERDGHMVWTTLTMADRRCVGYPGRDDADLINVLSSIEGAAISIIFVEQPNGNVKVSWRAQPGYDVSKIALMFGGGGHPAASGAEIENKNGNIEEIRQRILQETRQLLVQTENPRITRMGNGYG